MSKPKRGRADRGPLPRRRPRLRRGRDRRRLPLLRRLPDHAVHRGRRAHGRALPEVGGIFIQMEDELASMAAVLGAAWAGAKSMTVTSGPGFRLMMENIGLGVMTETPCVVVNVQRGGPSTGLPTLIGQEDMMQARWGSHGDYEIIALSPHSPQECFDLTITAFNLSEKYRVPVLFMMDECVGHMTEKVVIPAGRHDRGLAPALVPPARTDKYLPLRARQGRRAADGPRRRRLPLPHHRPDPRRARLPGHQRRVPATLRAAPRRTRSATTPTRSCSLEEEQVEGADVVVVAYGITARVATKAIADARQEGHQGRLPAADHGLALPGEAHPRAGAARSRPRGARDQPAARCPRGGARAAGGKCKTAARAPLRRRGPRPERDSGGHHGGREVSPTSW